MQYPPEAPLGLILAGGKARRMGGGDKPLRPLRDGTLLSAAIRSLAPQCKALVINAPAFDERWTVFGLPVVPDTLAGLRGPLAGVLAGLDHLHALSGSRAWLLTVPGDTPFPPADLVRRLAMAARAADVPIARAASGDRVHPAVALWSLAMREQLEAALRWRGLAKVRAFQDEVGVVDVVWSQEPWDPFFNVNTPDDLAMAEHLASLMTPSG